MRAILLLLVIAAVTAAQLEQITLADGRRFVGYYDETAGTLTASFDCGSFAAATPCAGSMPRRRFPHGPMAKASSRSAAQTRNSPSYAAQSACRAM